MVNNDLHVTERVVRAYNLCDRKAYLLIFSPSLSSPNAYEILQAALSNNVRQNFFDSISDQLKVESFSPLSILKAVDILTEVNLSVELFFIKNKTLIKAPDVLLQDKPHYEPIIFSSSNKIKAEDKVELAFIGYVLSKQLNYLPEKGHVVLIDGSTVKVKLAENIKKYIPNIEALQGWLKYNSGLPPVTLNKHCPYCEFQKACKETAVQEDSLSLLGGITKKQILKFEKKGIFTIKQLSFLYRPRKRGRRSHVERVAHKYELQALDLRTGNIYIQDNSTLSD